MCNVENQVLAPNIPDLPGGASCQVDMLTMHNIIVHDTLFIYFIIIIYTVDMKYCEVIEQNEMRSYYK